MVSYNYLGYGVTDENGIAKLEYNSEGQKRDHSYTGVGAGEIDVVASLDNPVVDGSIVSETYGVLDCIFYDTGIDGTKNTDWTYSNPNLIHVTSNGTIAKNTETGNLAVFPHSSSQWITNSHMIEFDIVDVSNSVKVQILDEIGTSELFDKVMPSSAIGETIKIKLGDVVEWWIGNAKQDNVNFYMDNVWFRFLIPSNASITFKNFKIYPI